VGGTGVERGPVRLTKRVSPMTNDKEKTGGQESSGSKPQGESPPASSVSLPNESVAATEPESPHDTVRRLMREAEKQRQRKESSQDTRFKQDHG
jgi:hypothetical protein